MKLNKIGGISISTVIFLIAMLTIRAAIHGGSTTARESNLSPSFGVREETPQQPPEPSPEPTVEPEPAEVMTGYRIKAQEAMDVLTRHIQARGWALSKLPRDELNAYCWEFRPKIQQMKDQLGIDGVNPDDLVPYEDVITGDIACRLAAHYRESGTAPEWASADLSPLEGLPPEMRQQEVSDEQAE